MTWALLIAILAATVATFVDKGVAAFQLASVYANLAALWKIAADNWQPMQRSLRRARLMVTNESMEWEIEVTIAEISVERPKPEALKDVLVQTLAKSKKKGLRDRKSDYRVISKTDTSISFYHKALGWQVEINLRPFSAQGPFLTEKDKWIVDLTINAVVPYRRTHQAFSGTLNEFLRSMENLLGPKSATKYVASLSADNKNPFAGSFVQNLKVDSIDRFNVTAALTESTKLEVSKRKITVISNERSDFLLNAGRILDKIA